MSTIDLLTTDDLRDHKNNQVVLIEYLGHSAQSVVKKSTANEELVVFCYTLHGVQDTSWCARALTNQQIRQFNPLAFEQFDEYWRADDEAMGVIESVFGLLEREGRNQLRLLINLYQDEEISLAFKKLLAGRLVEFFQTLIALRLLTASGLDVQFYPSASWWETFQWMERAGVKRNIPSGVVIMTSWHATIIRWESSRRVVLSNLFLLVAPWLIILRLRGIRWKAEPCEAEVGFRVYTTDWGFRGEGTIEIDWLIDDKSLRADNTIFVVERPISAEYWMGFAKRGYRALDISSFNPLRNGWIVSGVYLRELVSRGLTTWLMLILCMTHAPSIFVTVVGQGWFDYFRWGAFLELWHVKNYVVLNHLSFEQVFRNSRFRSAHNCTWFFRHSVGDLNAYFSTRPIWSQVIFAYFNYDYLIHWGERDARFHSRIDHTRHHLVIGPLWSSMVKPSSQIRNILRHQYKGYEGKIIAAFDTVFRVDAPYGSDGAQKFFIGILSMLSHPNYSDSIFLYKPKQSLDTLRNDLTSKAYVAFERLRAHPRCLILDDSIMPGAIIAEANLTISMAYTSTTVEALGAGRRAIYYDSVGKFPDSYYDQFPNLVAHDEESLTRLCDYWLSLSDEEFKVYLDTYIAPEFGGKLDGGAVSRFRSALLVP